MTFFPVLTTSSPVWLILQLMSDTEGVFSVFNKKQHNNSSDDCPYLVFTFSHAYKVTDLKEDHILHVVRALAM